MDSVETLPFYEYQLVVQKLNKHIEEQNKRNMERNGLKEAFSFSK